MKNKTVEKRDANEDLKEVFYVIHHKCIFQIDIIYYLYGEVYCLTL